jgi:[ribosomal protein S18]-alanine N-acetyltransferase
MFIREYNRQDDEAIIHLFRLNTPDYFSTTEEESLIDYLENHIERYYVMELNNEVVGCGGFNLADDQKTCKISWDILHPSYQGQGLGTVLLNYRLDQIKALDHIKIIVVRTSQVVYKFYEKAGFKLHEVSKDYWAEGFDLYRMEYLIK